MKLKMIADTAGVSLATVSRVFNHRDQVKQDTIAKVEKAMTELGYDIPQENKDGADNDNLIIVNIDTFSSPFFGEVLDGIQAALKSYGFSMLVNKGDISISTVGAIKELLRSSRANGYIALNSIETAAGKELKGVVPIVQCCEYNSKCDFPYVSVDDYSITLTAMRYMVSMGYKRIAFLNGYDTQKYARERKRAYLDVVKTENLEVSDGWIVGLPEVNFSMAYSAADRMLSGDGTRPDAFFAATDVFAAAVIRAALQKGLSIPEDIAVMGFDDTYVAQLMTPALTSVKQPRFQMGFAAGEMCVQMIKFPENRPRDILLDTELIIRESTQKMQNIRMLERRAEG